VVAGLEDTGRGAVRTGAAPELARRALRRAIHFASYDFVLRRRSTRIVRADGFRLTVRPTVFHPRYFIASEYFSRFVTQLNLRELRVADVGTGTGIIALSAARAGAAAVVAVDINPHAALSARENATAHGFGDRVSVVCGDLLSAMSPRARFDVILSNPPFFPEEPTTSPTAPGMPAPAIATSGLCSSRRAHGWRRAGGSIFCSRRIPTSP
jgi:release factor glutamine methyltransferase